jgi:DeoR family fructose operon transcriptional repressor
VLLVDSSKFGAEAFAGFGRLEQAHTVITDSGIRPEHLRELRNKVRDVVVVD